MAHTWMQTATTPGRRCWQRPLGTTESVYYWDGVWNGTGDTVMHVHLRAANQSDVDIYALDNVRRAWSSVKRRFPLLAAEVHEEDSSLRFVVREQGVTTLQDGEVVCDTVSSFHDAECFVDNFLDGPRPLSQQKLTRAYVLRRTDRPEQFHVIVTVAHCITDSCSTSTVLRTFFQTLATSYDPYPTPIEDRLQMYFPIESQILPNDLPLARRRWRKALGYAFHVVRRSQLRGGHTLPGNFTASTSITPAKSRRQVVCFPREYTQVILSNCRRHKITLNSAYHALSQVALSRLICRRYLRGEISEDEWEYRKREPMLFIGLANLRPYWDRNWFKMGGSGEVGLNFSFFHHSLPFMPLGAWRDGKLVHGLELVDGAPLFEDLMTFDRFLFRCDVVRQKNEKLFRHPRFLDMCIAGHGERLEPNKEMALNWRRSTGASGDKHKPLVYKTASVEGPGPGPVFTYAGSTLGDMDHMIPADYPLPAEHELSPLSPSQHPHRAGYPVCSTPAPGDVIRQCERPRLHVEHWRTHFRSRPGEVYLGAVTSKRQLQFFVFYDENVHSAEMIREWMGELKEATLWYLGRDHEGRGTKARCKL